jgi:hypothetical protein
MRSEPPSPPTAPGSAARPHDDRFRLASERQLATSQQLGGSRVWGGGRVSPEGSLLAERRAWVLRARSGRVWLVGICVDGKAGALCELHRAPRPCVGMPRSAQRTTRDGRPGHMHVAMGGVGRLSRTPEGRQALGAAQLDHAAQLAVLQQRREELLVGGSCAAGWPGGGIAAREQPRHVHRALEGGRWLLRGGRTAAEPASDNEARRGWRARITADRPACHEDARKSSSGPSPAHLSHSSVRPAPPEAWGRAPL